MLELELEDGVLGLRRHLLLLDEVRALALDAGKVAAPVS
jgi:hypothetical protein